MFTHQDKQLIEKLKKLPLDYWDFKEEDTKEFTHGIHNYPAMMVCPISRNIIQMVQDIRPVTALFDPFAGSGTVLVEGMLSGVDIVAGNDINPLALFLCKAKTTQIKNSDLEQTCANLLARIAAQIQKYSEELNEVDAYISGCKGLNLAAKNGWGDNASSYLSEYCSIKGMPITVPNFKNIGYWFRPKVILELSIIKAEIEKIKDAIIRNYVFVALSESIRLVSNRRNGEFKMFRMPPAKVLTFNPDVLGEFSKILQRNILKMDDFCSALSKIGASPSVSLFCNNACSLHDVPNDAYDLVITSPPYGDSRTTVAYGEYSRLSLQWINLSNLSEKEIMQVDKTLMGGTKYRSGFEFALKSNTLDRALSTIKGIDLERAGDVYSFYTDLDKAIAEIATKTKSGGYHFWVVGNRTVKNELLQTDVIITELAPQYGLVPIYTVDRNIPNKVMPSRNSPTNKPGKTNATITMEHIVVLRKE